MTYARTRLLLGTSAVGVSVLATAALVFFDIPSQFQARFGENLTIIVFVLGLVGLLLPWDLAGGYLAPTHYSRRAPSMSEFVRNWFKGVSSQVIVFLLVGFAVLAAGKSFGRVGAVATLAVAAASLLLLQKAFTLWVSSGRVRGDNASVLTKVKRRLEEWGFERADVVLVENSDPGFTGGIVGLPGFETIVLPAIWLDYLTPKEIATTLARRIVAIRSHRYSVTVICALAWLLVGFSLCSFLPTAGVASASQLVVTWCAFTWWTFLGLLVLPTLSRRGTYSLDRDTIEAGAPESVMIETVEKLDRIQDDEKSRPEVIESIFHPVPSISNRFSRSAKRMGCWHLNRQTLLLSWAGLSILSRAVHCNVGRPELWMMLPTD